MIQTALRSPIPLRPHSNALSPRPESPTPPSDIQTERAALGAIISDSRAAKIAFDILSRSDFYFERNQEIFEICKAIVGSIDAISFRNELKRLGKLELDDDGGIVASFLEIGSPANIENYCRELQRLSRARKLQSAASKALQSVDADSDAGLSATMTELFEIEVSSSGELDPVSAMKKQIEDEISGVRSAFEVPYFAAMTSTQCFLPGSITVICGSAGSSKSLLTLEMTWRMFIENQIATAKIDLESAAAFHLRRAMSQMANNSKLTQVKYSAQEPDQVMQVQSAFEGQILELVNKRVMQVPSSKRMDCANLLRWISQTADEGKQVLFIDPITMMDTGEKGWRDQEKFIQGARGIVDKKQIRLVIVTHPKAAGSVEADSIKLDNVAGSTAFTRFVDTVFWLEAHPALRGLFGNPFNSMETLTEEYNRTLHILKSRLGGTPKKRIGYFMDKETLRHIERGFLE